MLWPGSVGEGALCLRYKKPLSSFGMSHRLSAKAEGCWQRRSPGSARLLRSLMEGGRLKGGIDCLSDVEDRSDSTSNIVFAAHEDCSAVRVDSEAVGEGREVGCQASTVEGWTRGVGGARRHHARSLLVGDARCSST